MTEQDYKDAVKKIHKLAVAKQWSHAWCIEVNVANMGILPELGSGATRYKAWKDAFIKLNIKYKQ